MGKRHNHSLRFVLLLGLLSLFADMTYEAARRNSPAAQVLGARELGRLRAESAVPALAAFVLDEGRSYVGRVAATEALGQNGGQEARQTLQQATQSPRPSVVGVALRALAQLQKAEQEIPL